MQIHRAVAAQVVAQLTNGLQERQAFDVADGAADLAQDEVFVLQVRGHEVLDGIGDVGNDLDGGAQIVAAPFLGDHV